METGIPRVRPISIAAGPSGKKNSASITSNGKCARILRSTGINARAMRKGVAGASRGTTGKRGRWTVRPAHVSRTGKPISGRQCGCLASGPQGIPTGATTSTLTSLREARARVCRSTKIPNCGRAACGKSVESVSTFSTVGPTLKALPDLRAEILCYRHPALMCDPSRARDQAFLVDRTRGLTSMSIWCLSTAATQAPLKYYILM